MKKLTTILAAASLLLASGFAFAADSASATAQNAVNTEQIDPVVYIGDRAVFKFRAAASDLTPGERWAITMERLKRILAHDVAPEDVRIVERNGTTSIYIRSSHFVTVTTADARANNSTVPSLARMWAANVRSGLVVATDPA